MCAASTGWVESTWLPLLSCAAVITATVCLELDPSLPHVRCVPFHTTAVLLQRTFAPAAFEHVRRVCACVCVCAFVCTVFPFFFAWARRETAISAMHQWPQVAYALTPLSRCGLWAVGCGVVGAVAVCNVLGGDHGGALGAGAGSGRGMPLLPPLLVWMAWALGARQQLH